MGIAVWTPVFTQLKHEYIGTVPSNLALSGGHSGELSNRDVIKVAIVHGPRVEALPVSDTPFQDSETPQDLVRAVQQFCSKRQLNAQAWPRGSVETSRSPYLQHFFIHPLSLPALTPPLLTCIG